MADHHDVFYIIDGGVPEVAEGRPEIQIVGHIESREMPNDFLEITFDLSPPPEGALPGLLPNEGPAVIVIGLGGTSTGDLLLV